jgi:thiamine-phosphate pyrophosphorylase
LSEVSALWRAALRLSRAGRGWKALPPLLLFTDPARTPRPEGAAARLPRGCGVVYRAFGAPDAVRRGHALAKVCRRRGLVFIVGADPALAARLGADGVHLPERLSRRAGAIRALRRRFMVTAAAHGLPAALAARRAGVPAVIVSPIFPSLSPSAGRPLGRFALAAIVRAVGGPVYALGGVNARTVRSLGLTGAAGIAGVEALVS